MTGRFNGGGLIPRVRDCGTVCLVCRYTREERGKRVVAFYREPLRCISGMLVAPYGRRELFDKWMTPELLFIVRAKLLEISRFAEISLSLSLFQSIDWSSPRELASILMPISGHHRV